MPDRDFKFQELTAGEWAKRFMGADGSLQVEGLKKEFGSGPAVLLLETLILSFAEAYASRPQKINEMFHFASGRLVKTSNGQPIPEDEPVFILRGRDNISLAALMFYVNQCRRDGVPSDRIGALDGVVDRFAHFRTSCEIKMKQPGSTHGK